MKKAILAISLSMFLLAGYGQMNDNNPNGKIEESKVKKEETSEEHHHGDVSMHLEKPEVIKSSEQTPLSVRLEKGELPLTDARVRLEILKQGLNPAWVDLKEAVEGAYKANYAFSSAGTYIVKIHVENDEGLHEHTEVEIIVQ